MKYLISKDSKNKFRMVELNAFWDESIHGYIIDRKTGCVGGKITTQPAIIIKTGKSGRTVTQQKDLEFESNRKKYLDKGYVEVKKHPNEYSEVELSEIFGDVVTNQFNVIKPMLAKQESKLTNRKILDKEWLCSRKIDGVRALFVFDGEEIHAYSRGGDTYDPATTHLRENTILNKFFRKNPNVILDGELYFHGKSLQFISGAARMEKNAYDCDWLQYWIYDCYDKSNPDMKANDRIMFLNKELGFITSDNVINKIDNICLVHHTVVTGEENIWKLHNQYVSEGFEGCVIRDPNKPYKPNGRTNDMLKFKQYKDDCFLVIGIEGGLRGVEDMIFILETKDGKVFKAKPMGNLEQKQEYWDNFEFKYKNHIGECKFFYYSEDNTPLQPTFKAFRDDLK